MAHDSNSSYDYEADCDDIYAEGVATDQLDDTLVACPNCHEQIYEDVEFCPYCREYITHSTNPFADRPFLWTILGLFGMIAVIVIMLLSIPHAE